MLTLLAEARRHLAASDYTKKPANKLDVGDRTWCKKGGRFDGVSVGRDKDGSYVFTHRARSKSYSDPDTIPKSKIAFIRSTG